jgi:hypothetical protein
MLTKHDQESGGKKYGKKKAHGQVMLKTIFRSAVQSAMGSNTMYKRKYEAMLALGKSKKAARGAVARHIAATVLGVWKSGKKYDDKHKEVTQRRNRKSHSDT